MQVGIGQPATNRSNSKGFGLAKFGTPWAQARGVLICVHGRDREPEELADLFADAAKARSIAVLCPYVVSKVWYSGRYDASMASNADGIHSSLGQIQSAIELALNMGFKNRHIVLAGFSQGGCLVAEYLLSDKPRPAAAAVFSGALPDLHNRTDFTQTLAGMPVVVSGGEGDIWLPVSDLKRTSELLEYAGATIRYAQFSDEDHLVRPAEVAALAELLDLALA